jgi:hypothetical protein
VERLEIELGEFLVNCFTQLSNIHKICYKKLNKMMILEYIPHYASELRKIVIDGHEGGKLLGYYEDEEEVKNRLGTSPAPGESLINVLFSFYVSLPPEAQESFNAKMVETFTNIAAEGL